MTFNFTTEPGGIDVKGWATLAVAITVALVALLSYLVNRQKLRLDLYEKRYALYNNITLLAARVFEIDKHESTGKVEEAYRYVAEADFLFGPEVSEEVRRCANLMAKASIFMSEVSNPVASGEARAEAHSIAHKQYLPIEEHLRTLRKMVQPFLSFSKIGVEGQLVETAKSAVQWYKRNVLQDEQSKEKGRQMI